MKSKIFFSLALCILLTASVSAVVVDGEWSDGSVSVSITEGQSIDFTAYAFSIDPPLTLDIMLYSASDLDGEPVHTFENNLRVESGSFSQTYLLSPGDYGSPGNFILEFHGVDEFPGSDTFQIELTVNPLPPPVNNAPVIISVPVTSVNENTAYSYDVDATDADGNTLTYSLTANPAWLSIDSSTGLITGTAPGFAIDTPFVVTVLVSDGTATSLPQTYILTVIDTSGPPVPDTTAPTITLNSPADNFVTNNSSVTFNGHVVDNVGIDGVFLIIDSFLIIIDPSGLNDVDYIFNENLADGVHTWQYVAQDFALTNTAFSPIRTLTVDTTAPAISFGASTPADLATLTQNNIPVSIIATDATSGIQSIIINLYDSNNNLINSASSATSPLSLAFTGYSNGTLFQSGTYRFNATTIDNAGNMNSTLTRTITLIVPAPTNNDDDSSSGNGNVVYSSTDTSSGSEGEDESHYTSPKISLGGKKAASSATTWTGLFIILSILALGTIALIIILIKRK